MRTFIALDLPKEIVKEIEGIQKILKKQNLFTGKFTESENLHLTLKFLGEVEEDKIEQIKKKLSEINLEGFYCEIGEVGVFTKQFIKIVWIKLNGKGIFDLQKEIDKKLSDLFEPEERFMSHLTIARVKHVSSKKDLLEYLKPQDLNLRNPSTSVHEKANSNLDVDQEPKNAPQTSTRRFLTSIKPKKLRFFCNKFYLKKSELRPKASSILDRIEEKGHAYEDIAEYKLE